MTRKPSSELIDAVRRCAAKGMSAQDAANELGFVSRNAVIGMAHRNGIKFSGTQTNKPKAKRRAPFKALPKYSAPNAVTVRAKIWVKPPRASCSWAGCTGSVDEGSMFCFSHGKRGLFG